jgi:metal-responsive CopG/Arc/MetJ family transcriptional regulator
MKTAISIPDDLFRAADDLARRLGVSRSELYQRAVAHYLRSRGHDIIRETLDEVYASDDDSRLDPAIEHIQNSTIKEDW